jgi:hypothetical protein
MNVIRVGRAKGGKRLRVKPLSRLVERKFMTSLPQIREGQSPFLANRLREKREIEHIASTLLSEEEAEDEKERYVPEGDEYVSETAKSHFYSKYKSLKTILKKNEFYQAPRTALVAMLVDCEARGIVPKSMGLVRESGDESVIQLENMGYGDEHVQNLAKALSLYENRIMELHLSKNNLRAGSVQVLLRSVVDSHPKLINLAGNEVDVGCCRLLKEVFKASQEFKEVNLSDTGLDTECIEQIMYSSASLNRLDLSSNGLNDLSLLAISRIVVNMKVLELNLRWNKIQTACYNEYFWSNLAKSQLGYLNLAFNLLETDAAIGFCHLLEHSTLKHADLSANSFSLADCQIIADKLRENTELVGFHFEGNYGSVDDKGFLLIDSCARKEILVTGADSSHNCWVCNRYTEVSFHWGGECHPALKVHLESYQFEPRDIGPGGVTVLVQEGPQSFFFSVHKVPLLDPGQATRPISFRLAAFLKDYPDLLEGGSLNVLEASYTESLLNPFYQFHGRIKPRTLLPYTPASIERKDWSFRGSQFRSQSALKACFAADLEKLRRGMKEEEQAKVRELLESWYPRFLVLYMRLTYLSYYHEGFQLQPQPLVDFLTNIGFIDKAFSPGEV